MRITGKQLRKIIREELELKEVRRGRPQIAMNPPARVLSTVGPVEKGVAYIDPSFQDELMSMGFGLQTGEDLAAAVAAGVALVWSSGVVGGAAEPSLTVVPPDAKIRSYPYVFTQQDPRTRETEAVVQIGMGTYESGPLIYSNNPRAMARPEDLERSVTSIVPLDLMGGIDVPETAADAALDIGFAHRRSSGYREY